MNVAGVWSDVSNTSVEWVAAMAVAHVTCDESLAGSLDECGYLPLLEWISDRSLVAAACLAPEMEAVRATELLAAIFRRLLQAAVWAAETSDVTLLQRQVAACPPLLVHPVVAIAGLARLVLDGDANANAATVAATLRAATPLDAAVSPD